MPTGTRICSLLPALAAVAQILIKSHGLSSSYRLILGFVCSPSEGSLMLWWGFGAGAELGEPRLLSQGGGSALVPHGQAGVPGAPGHVAEPRQEPTVFLLPLVPRIGTVGRL